MKPFLSSLCKLDSSAHILRDRTASLRQSQLFTALSQASGTIDKSINKGTDLKALIKNPLVKLATLTGLAAAGMFLDPSSAQAATTTLNFDGTPVLVSGTALSQGAVYRYPSVTTGIDAMVQIETIQNAQLKNLDDNTTFASRFQPVIAPASAALINATSYVKFNFKLIPSSTSSGTTFAAAPVATATNVYFSSQDTDGSGVSNTIREFVEVTNALATYIANPTLLQSSTPIAGGTLYEVANSLDLQAGIGTDDRYEVYSYLGESVGTFSIIGGNKTGSTGCVLNSIRCDRQNSWTFNVADVQKLDFGDAPLSFGNAFHSVPASPTVRLGTSVDGDDQPSYTTAADGDGADDDGVASFPTLTSASTNYSVNLTCAGNNAAVAGWIDFNKNNTFDPGERAAGTCNGTSATLNWSGLSGLTVGNTYARFRISSTASEVTNPTGQAFDGEVEDYQVSITTPPAPVTPFRDRINSCGLITFDTNSEGFRAATITASGTNYNAFTISPQSAPYANSSGKFEWQSIGNPGGSIFTDDLDTQWTIFTTPDLGTDTNFSFLNTKSLTFDYRSDTGVAGTYDFWVALVGKNGSKVFYSFKTQLTGASKTQFSKVLVPMDAAKWFTTFQTPGSAAPTAAGFASILANLDRIDIGAEGITGPDHTEIDNMGMGCDRGDAPNTYGTLAASNGPSHQITSTLKLGAKIDADSDGQPTPNADGDDQDLSASNRLGIVDDEDGISSFPVLSAGATNYSIPAANITAIGTGTLHAWIDFNKNGAFDVGEYKSVAVTNNVLAGALNWTGITAGAAGNTFARFRFTSDASITASTPTGMASDGEVEDYKLLIVASGVDISGTVFEDPNYGGGAGRNLATANTSVRDGATVELYESDGTYLKNTTTSGGGKYTLTGIAAGDYQVRVVNSTVTSSRPNPTSATGLVAVQTFRTDASVTAGTVTAVTNHVGGEIPKEVDAPANTTANLTALNAVTNQEVQSLTAVKVASTAITGIDFGYNFDTIVNTNDSGQGSLRQFMLNSNALSNTGLDQVANLNPATGTTAIDAAPGIETSIFMIPSTALTTGFANIALASILTVTADDTALDGRTQTANIGDTNSGTLGASAQPVGISAQLLPNYPKPEIFLSMSTGAASDSIEIQGNGDSVIGLGFSTNIKGGITVSGGSAAKPTLIQSNIMGLKPDGTAGSVRQSITANQTINPSKYLNILDNLISNNSFAGVSSSSQGLIQGNHFIRNGTGSCDDNLSVEQSSINTITINKNLFENAAANGIEGYGIDGGVTITENTIRTSGRNGTLCDGSIENDGIRLFGSSSKVQKNIINNNGGAGVVFTGSGGTKNLISQNSFFQNGTLGIDLDAFLVPSINPTGDGVTPNDGIKNTKPNNGMDYPIITSSVLSGGNLTVKGYVGNVAAGSVTFATATLEFFIADDDFNNNGPVILGDGKSKPHGEGKTYIGGSTTGDLCVTTANGLFNCTFSAPVGFTNAQNITATATDSLGSTSEFSAAPSGKAQLLLVKRITAIKDGVTGLPLKNAAGVPISFGGFVDDTTSTTKTDDNNCNWLNATGAVGACTNTYTVGAITQTAPKVKPGDEIEYTIYYLNPGENKATARVCDRLNPNLTFQPNFDPSNVAKGIGFNPGNTGITYLTNLGTDSDKGQLTNASVTGCNLPANSGTEVVAVDVGDATTPLLGSTSPGAPTGSYGYIRFRAVVK